MGVKIYEHEVVFSVKMYNFTADIVILCSSRFVFKRRFLAFPSVDVFV